MSESKNIFITGGARGVGRVLGRFFALKGHRVFLVDIDEEELKYAATVHIPKFLAEQQQQQHPTCESDHATQSQRVFYKTTDLGNPVAISEAVKAAAEAFGGRIDVVINNAGIARAHWTGGRSMDDPSINTEWAAYLAVNLTAPFLVSQACIPYMKTIDATKQDPLDFHARPEALASAAGKSSAEISAAIASSTPSPCIINISSFRALQSEPNSEGYAATKAGLLGLTHALAMTGARWGIRCNAILPGFIYVLHETRKGDEAGETWAGDVPEARHRTHPAGRIGLGDDVARTVEWLMGADFVTGQEIVVDGGCSKVKHPHA